MTTWRPGLPVLTAEDRATWQQWRRERKREQQRERRAQNTRIDYYPDDEAAEIVYALAGPYAGHDLSSVLNRIVREWSAKVPPE